MMKNKLGLIGDDRDDKMLIFELKMMKDQELTTQILHTNGTGNR